MTEARAASRTAIMVAAHRGRASAGPNAICHDPWALGLAGLEGEALSLRWDEHFPSMVLWMALRTRYIDDCVTRALDRGVRQVVVLGAGLDTRAARLAREGVRFFEVDQPASQVDKCERLSRFDAYPMDAATFVPCDFERDDFVQLLEAAGLDGGSPVCFVWEGVIYYQPASPGRRPRDEGHHRRARRTHAVRHRRPHALDAGVRLSFPAHSVLRRAGAAVHRHLCARACLSLSGHRARERK
ncbi:MAG: class I SAM-dependent methyltransferase [Deltaproteobacteria bacterium]|nr:class I SAM-dependent methyltransferase [Deltaproteobacteria bacterium]